MVSGFFREKRLYILCSKKLLFSTRYRKRKTAPKPKKGKPAGYVEIWTANGAKTARLPDHIPTYYRPSGPQARQENDFYIFSNLKERGELMKA